MLAPAGWVSYVAEVVSSVRATPRSLPRRLTAAAHRLGTTGYVLVGLGVVPRQVRKLACLDGPITTAVLLSMWE
jgi:hypothetical protein